MSPEIVVLNSDDKNYEDFSEFKGTKETISFGQSGADVKILNSKLYPKGTEATLSIKSEVISVATFIAGETAVSYMACAAATASGLGFSTDNIIDGIAEYNPE